MSVRSQFEKALASINLEPKRYDPGKVRCITVSSGGTFSLEKFMDKARKSIGPEAVKYPDFFPLLFDADKFQKALDSFCEEKGITKGTGRAFETPEQLQGLTLNMDVTHPGREGKYFMTTKDEYISTVSGASYLKLMRLKDEDIASTARIVVPEYHPHDPPGISTRQGLNTETDKIYNTYLPPAWMRFEGKVDPKPPKLFMDLVNHLFPIREEREYFFDWLHDSLFSRSYVYLVLCGAPAAGKNRLKLVLRALHGHQNTVDGKKSTLKERFNSQLDQATLGWFDELHYDMEMENVMKELQNDTISIEKKGVDATRATKIYASLVISNNKPRDNYIAFDARKFAPLQVTSKRLDSVMLKKDIAKLTDKVEDWSKDTYDVEFLAQIGRWIKKRGKTGKWPHLEYKGPMFYQLVHTSMSRWQKRAAHAVLTTNPTNSSRVQYDAKKGFLWSTFEELTLRRGADKSMSFPDYTTVKHFFDIFVDAEGKKAFVTTPISKNTMGDFWVKAINKKAHIVTEAEVLEQSGGEDEEDDGL